MKYEYRDYDSVHYTVKVRRSGNNGIDWETGKQNDAIVIQCPYQEYPYQDLHLIMRELEATELVPGRFTGVTVNGTVYGVRYVDKNEKAREKGCSNIPNAFSYVVFACSDEPGEKRIIYAPNTKPDPEYCRQMQRIDMPLKIILTHGIEVAFPSGLGGLLGGKKKKKGIPTGFHIVDTDMIGASLGGYEYTDGEIFYTIEGVRIPITKEMLWQKIVIRTEQFPEFQSLNKAIEIVCIEQGEGEA